MKFGAAPTATALEPNLRLDHRPALRAPDDLSKPRHVDIAGTILRNPAGSGRRARLLRWARRGGFFRTIAVVILVPAQTVFSIAHVLYSLTAGILCDGEAGSKLAFGRPEARAA
jgi:hypothetical protein